MKRTGHFEVSIRGSFYAWGVLVLLTLIYICSFVDRQIIAVLAPQIQADLELSNFQVGLLYGTAFSVIYAVSGVPMGRLADLYSRKWMIIAGLTVWSLMTAVSGFATSLTFLISARLLVGVSEAALSPAVYSLLSDFFTARQRATVFSVYASGIFLGIGASFLIGGTVAELYDWRTALVAVGIPGLLLALVAALLIKEIPRSSRTATAGEADDEPLSFTAVLRYLLEKRTVRWHLAGFSLLAFSGYTILAFISTVLTEIHEAAYLVPHYGWFMFATGISVMLSGKFADLLAHYWDASKRFLMGIVAGLAGLPLYYLGLYADAPLKALVLIGFANVISSSYNGVAAALIQYFVSSRMRALAGGVYLFVISVMGFGLGPPLTGWLIDHLFTGPRGTAHALFLVMSSCGILATGCFLKAMKTYDRDAEPENITDQHG
ncbi:MAG: spinster family MFS transporter [Balneolaceae bacterium]